MSALPTSEYKRNFSWNLSDGYSRSCPLVEYKPTNICYRPNSVDFMDTSSRIDHKAIAKQYMKLNPQLNGIRDGTKSDYELSISTYKDTFRKNARFPSMADYIQIANNVTDEHFPDSVKYFYEQEESRESDDSPKRSSNLKTVDVRFPKSHDSFLMKEDFKNNNPTPKKSLDPNTLPKITDLGSCFYRNDISPECMPRGNPLQEYISETKRKITTAIRRNEFEEEEIKRPNRKPKRYIDLPVY